MKRVVATGHRMIRWLGVILLAASACQSSTGHEVALNTPDAAACFLEVMRSFYDDPAAYNTACVAMLRIPPFITD